MMERLSLGFGPVIPSAQETALNTDGYSGGRVLGMLDGVGMLGPRWGFGGFLGGATRNTRPTHDAPSLTDYLVFVGPEGVLLLGDGRWRFPLLVRVGYAGGTESFHGGGRWQSAPALGLEAGLLYVGFPIGLGVGGLFAPAGAPGDQGRSWDMGSFYLSVMFHVEQ